MHVLPPFGGGSPPLGGGNPSSPLRGGGGPLLPFGGGRKGGPSRREGLVAARHAWLTWPWASQAATRGRCREPAVLATCMPTACEWAAGCAGEGEGPCTQSGAESRIL